MFEVHPKYLFRNKKARFSPNWKKNMNCYPASVNTYSPQKKKRTGSNLIFSWRSSLSSRLWRLSEGQKEILSCSSYCSSTCVNNHSHKVNALPVATMSNLSVSFCIKEYRLFKKNFFRRLEWLKFFVTSLSSVPPPQTKEFSQNKLWANFIQTYQTARAF